MKILFLICIVSVLFSCQGKDSSLAHQADINAIKEMSKKRAEAFNAGDGTTIAQYFTEDGILMAPGKKVSQGRPAVEAYYSGIFGEFETVLESYYEEVEVSGDLGFGRGEAQVTLIAKATGDTTYASSKYLNILKKQTDGTWKTTHDIWNDND